MSEQRPRLLPFRLRRERGGRHAAGLYRAEEVPADDELRELLAAWRAPDPDPGARARLLADFRAHTARAPRWRRLLAARVSVPLPLAAGAVGALVFAALALAALSARGSAAPPTPAAAPAVRVVEVPVPQERVVTRFVYVERGGRTAPATRARSAVAPARDDPSRVEAEGADATSYFTGVDMAEFHPADQMKIRVIKKARPEEEPAKADAEPERKGR